MKKFLAKRLEIDRRVLLFAVHPISVDELAYLVWRNFSSIETGKQRDLTTEIELRCAVLASTGRLLDLGGGIYQLNPSIQYMGRDTTVRGNSGARIDATSGLLPHPYAPPGITRSTLHSERVRIRRPAVAAVAAIMVASCGTFNSSSGPAAGAEGMPRYQAQKPPSLSAFYQPAGRPVYRFCGEGECPVPTRKTILSTAFDLDSGAHLAETSPGSVKALDTTQTQQIEFPPLKLAESLHLLVVAKAQEESRHYAVFFKFNSSRVSQDYAELIRLMGPSVEHLTKVRLIGRTDSAGSKALNELMAQRRAEAVATVLERMGVARQKISIDTDPMTDAALSAGVLATTIPAGDSAKMRRVDIEILRRVPSKVDRKDSA